LTLALANSKTGICDSHTTAARLTIDVGAVAENWRHLARLSHPARTAAVVKANGYGLGIAHVVPVLNRAGCKDFFVATVAEGIAARTHAPAARIFILNGLDPDAMPAFGRHALIPVIASLPQASLWARHNSENGRHPCAIQIDTGMNRLGLTLSQARALLGDMEHAAQLNAVLVMSHLACADDPDHPMNGQQLQAFQAFTRTMPDHEASLSNSAGIHLGPQFAFDLTRPGIALYGGRSCLSGQNPMRPTVTAQAPILQIRQARPGETVSYGASAVLDRDTRIAVVGVGYADGYPRSLSGAGIPLRGPSHGFADLPRPCVWIAGGLAPILGRVTMDLTMVDITDLPAGAVREGDFVELFGHNLALDDVAAAAGTIGYEILTALGARYRRSITGAG